MSKVPWELYNKVFIVWIHMSARYLNLISPRHFCFSYRSTFWQILSLQSLNELWIYKNNRPSLVALASFSCCCDIKFPWSAFSFVYLASSCLLLPYPRSLGFHDINCCFFTGTAGKLAKGSDGRLWYSSRNVLVFRWLFWKDKWSVFIDVAQ